MVEVKMGQLLDSSAQTLVNTVNTVGVMGKGIALEFKKRFPDMYEDYARRCREGRLRLGEPYLFRRPSPPWVLNFPTKDHWRAVSRLADIERGLEYLDHHYKDWGITSLAVPPLGCGQGQLEWRVVGPVLLEHLQRLDLPVELFAPLGTPEEQLSIEFLGTEARDTGGRMFPQPPYRLEPAWFALVEALARIEREPYHPPIGRIAFQKLAYFATVAAIPTGLHYERGSYGPYSAQLKPVLSRLINNGLIQEQPRGDMLEVRVGQAYPGARGNYSDSLKEWESAIEDVADLLMRMNSRQTEIAATVHFTAASLRDTDQGSEPSEEEVVNEVLRWKHRRKPAFTRDEVSLSVRAMGMLGWLHVRPSDSLALIEQELVGG